MTSKSVWEVNTSIDGEVTETDSSNDLKVIKDPELLKFPFRGLTFSKAVIFHPKLKEISQQTEKWAEKFTVFQRMDKAQMESRCIFSGGAYLGSGNCYDMPDSIVQLHSDLMAFTLLFDDLVDNCDDLNAAKYWTNGYCEILFGEKDAIADEFTKNDFWTAAMDIRNRCPLNGDQRIAYAKEVKLCCDAVYQICEWQIKRSQPDLETYLNQRGYDNGGNFYTLFGILVHNYPNFCQEDFDNEELHLIKKHSYRYIGIALDLQLIHKKEEYYERRLYVNSVVLVKRSKNCSWKEALDIVYGLLHESEEIANSENDRLKGKYPEICFHLMQMVYVTVDLILKLRDKRYK